jgi:hypothetical protein
MVWLLVRAGHVPPATSSSRAATPVTVCPLRSWPGASCETYMRASRSTRCTTSCSTGSRRAFPDSRLPPWASASPSARCAGWMRGSRGHQRDRHDRPGGLQPVLGVVPLAIRSWTLESKPDPERGARWAKRASQSQTPIYGGPSGQWSSSRGSGRSRQFRPL